MKAEHSHVGNATNAFPVVSRAQRMRRIFNQQRSVLLPQFPQFIKRGGMPRIIDRDDGLGVGRKLLGDFLRIKTQRIRRDICEYRPCALIQNAVRRCTESHRSCDGFIARSQSGRKRRTVQCGRSRTEADRASRADARRKPLFEFDNLRTCSQPVRLQNLNHCQNVCVIQALPSIGQQCSPHGRTPMDGKCPQFSG